jgi:uncharacterized protein with HEPN domain
VDFEIVWRTIQADLPIMHKQVVDILEGMGHRSDPESLSRK